MIPLQLLDTGASPPVYAREGDAGADLVSAVDVTIKAGGGRAIIPTGVAFALPEGYVALVHPRSGLAAKHGVTTLNAPGTIDSGYRGEVHVVLVNTDPEVAFDVRRGDRIAQVVVQRFEVAQWDVVAELDPSERGAGGFGHTG